MTIKFKNVTKFFEYKGNKNFVFENASCEIPTEGNLAVLGLDSSGKSAFMNLISGTLFPDSGKVKIDKERVSWQVAYKNCISLSLTGRENVEFITLLQESAPQKRKKIREFIYDFCNIEDKLDIPFRIYSKSIKARLYFATCLAFDFDTYILDDFSYEEDTFLYNNAEKFIKEERPNSRVIFTSKDLKKLEEKADIAVLIKDKKIYCYDRPAGAITDYKRMLDSK